MSGGSKHIYSVYDLTVKIKYLLEDAFPEVWVEGEISNFKRHFSGHYYFSVKDEKAQIPCVMWKGKTLGLPFVPEDGMKVQLRGSLTVYEKSGRYQLDTQLIYPKGIGELQIAFEQLKKRLEAEGLFDGSRKRPIPFFSTKIGLVTSPTGAVIRDITNVAFRRYPGVRLILYPVKVQGDGAAEEIAAGIKQLNNFGDIDVIICGRGGGSLEDLWAFNEETVARAIAGSAIPVISAVGHETDFTIADFTADMRAPTPSAAAEIAVPEKEDLVNTIQILLTRMHKRVSEKMAFNKERLNGLENSYGLKRPVDLIRQYSQQLDDTRAELEDNFLQYLNRRSERIDSLSGRLNSLNPEQVLRRGYGIIYKPPHKSVVKSISQISEGSAVIIQVSDGSAESVVQSISKKPPEF